MTPHKFSEVLNDTINYFILGDIRLLQKYKLDKTLPDDLATELTTNETGDEVVEKGIIIPMIGVENYPYTVMFHESIDTVELLRQDNELQLRQSGYILQVENGEVHLFTWRILEDFTEKKLERLLYNYSHQNKPNVKLDNGWYDVEIFGGLTTQETEVVNLNGEMVVDHGKDDLDLEFGTLG